MAAAVLSLGAVVMTTRQVTVPILDASVSRGVTGYLSGD